MNKLMNVSFFKEVALQLKIRAALMDRGGRMSESDLKRTSCHSNHTTFWNAAFYSLQKANTIRIEGTGVKGDPKMIQLLVKRDQEELNRAFFPGVSAGPTIRTLNQQATATLSKEAALQLKIRAALEMRGGRMSKRDLERTCHFDRTTFWNAAFYGLQKANIIRIEGTGVCGDPKIIQLLVKRDQEEV